MLLILVQLIFMVILLQDFFFNVHNSGFVQSLFNFKALPQIFSIPRLTETNVAERDGCAPW